MRRSFVVQIPEKIRKQITKSESNTQKKQKKNMSKIKKIRYRVQKRRR